MVARFAALYCVYLISVVIQSQSAIARLGNLATVVSLPDDWRSRLTDDVYNYHLNRVTANHLPESDITGSTKYSEISHSAGGAAETSHDRKLRFFNAVEEDDYLWKDGVVPYEISHSFMPDERMLIKDALSDIMKKTCIRFVPYHDQKDYLSFVKRGLGCSSYVGRSGGSQLIDLMRGCMARIGEIQHEVMHALGFFHEQSRLDRDDHVTIIWQNIRQGAEHQFAKYKSTAQNMSYDYNSVMHYGWNYFAKDPTRPTIVPKVKRRVALGTRTVMSTGDVEKINQLYECSQRNHLLDGRFPTPTHFATYWVDSSSRSMNHKSSTVPTSRSFQAARFSRPRATTVRQTTGTWPSRKAANILQLTPGSSTNKPDVDWTRTVSSLITTTVTSAAVTMAPKSTKVETKPTGMNFSVANTQADSSSSSNPVEFFRWAWQNAKARIMVRGREVFEKFSDWWNAHE